MTKKRRSFSQACTSLGMGKSALRRLVQQLAGEREGLTLKNKALIPEQRWIQKLEACCKGMEQEKDTLKRHRSFDVG